MAGFVYAGAVPEAAGATDMGRGFEGLYGLARDWLSCDPLSGPYSCLRMHDTIA